LEEQNRELWKENTIEEQTIKDLEQENNELLDENINYIQKTTKKEYKIINLRWEIRTMIVYFGGMLTVILIINIIAHLLGFGCFKSCKKRKQKQTSRNSFNYSLAADDDEDTDTITSLV